MMSSLIAALRNHKGLLWQLAQIVLVLVSLLFLALDINRNWITLRETTIDLGWIYAAQAMAILLGAWTIIAMPSYLALRRCTSSVTYLRNTLIFCISQVVKYLPGGLWTLPGRMVLYQKHYDLHATLALYLVLWETFAILFGAILVSMLAWSAIPSYLLQMAWLGAVAISVAVTQLGGQPYLVYTWLIRYVPPLGRRLAGHLAEYADVTSGTLWAMVLSAGVFWLVTGIGFHQLVTAVIHSSATVGWLESIGIFALAWVLGFMIVFVPAGIGIREGALVVLLRPFVGDADALVIALLGRLWWTIAEALWSIVALALMRTLKP